MNSFYQIVVFLPGLRFALASKISEVRAYVGGQVDIDCPYPADYIHVAKYWCRDPCNDADVLVKSETSDTYISKGRFSLYDNSNGRSLSVTIKKLTLKDAGMYYCGVEKWWKDKLRKVHVQVRKASPATTVVPKTDPARRLLTLLDRSMLVTQRHVTQLSTDPTTTIMINLQSVTVEKANHSTGHLSIESNSLDFAVPLHNDQDGADLGHVYDEVAFHDPADLPQMDSPEIYHVLSFSSSHPEMTEN
ncbi:CMRF35-like molecule 6 isoform X2 [Paramormyrops kingsleyae]|uniref:CMRF35-like molecule 6 isoform X2 n=1 Tax=Paramormyrops kingsleyae TaxID=1676925 RepID=UPI003B971796